MIRLDQSGPSIVTVAPMTLCPAESRIWPSTIDWQAGLGAGGPGSAGRLVFVGLGVALGLVVAGGASVVEVWVGVGVGV